MLQAVVTHATSPCAWGALASSSRLLGVLGNSLAVGSATERARINAGTGFPWQHSVLGRHMSTAQGPGVANRDDTSLPPPSKLQQGGSFAAGVVAPHPGIKGNIPATPAELQESFMSHPAYDWEYLEGVRPTHTRPEKLYQHVGLTAIRVMRRAFDLATGYGPNMTEAKWLQRMIFLETVAGVPGMVAGMLRHLKSLRTMKRDHGWIHTLLEEAENERMHLITFFELRQPGPLFRAAVIVAQGVFFNLYFLSYLLSPRTCHAFVGFLEEEAVKTYTHALQEIDAGRLWKDRPAPPVAVQYWGLKEGATMRDLILAVRADEACHAHVNHTLSKLRPHDANPFATGASQLP